ncbi:MAG: putative sulfate exporter family transporter [Actinoallomurus sp.]|jgi:uncharacterized integral membrane protein (TIGR00698 family)|nr:putative sulfate exporter family transporter [Actinoallomurus sp.]
MLRIMATSTVEPRVRAHDARPTTSRDRRGRQLAPGLVACAAGVAGAWGLHRLAGAVPLLTAALLLGVLTVNTGLLPQAARAGTRFAATTLMRAGVVLLGLQVALGDIAGLGWQTIVMTVIVLLATLFGTRWLGHRMGLSARMSLLVASGFAICGASAVAAVKGVLGERSDETERDAATAVALVTLCGTLAIAVMPAAGHLLGLSAYDEGRWIGASVHDVGQVVATATVVGPAALVPAVAVKLIRVAMLAPVTAVIAVRARRDAGSGTRRPAVLPAFLLGFLAMVAVRATGTVPHAALDAANTTKDVLFAAALFGLGSAVRLGPLLRTGRRALLLGLASWALVAGVSYAGVLLTR